ncbi:MAG TPA: AAA family ATPase, partial [Acidimicrobiales bacterium]|nr:AAA family ATPase [Acidimicrobiales bacterium]
MSRLDLVVGPNGAGKSTFVELVLADVRPGTTFVNADVIAAQRWPDDPVGHGHDAARAAAQIRDAVLERGDPFIAETVASHPSKVDLV